MPDEPRDETTESMQLTKEKLAIIDAWVKKLMVRSGIQCVSFASADRPDAPLGLVGVPSRYCAIVDAMHQAMHAIVLGEDLPIFTLPPVKSAKRRR